MNQLLRHALPMARQIAALKRRAEQQGVPVVYVNDNFGRWRSDFSAQVEHCLQDGRRGRPVGARAIGDEKQVFRPCFGDLGEDAEPSGWNA